DIGRRLPIHVDVVGPVRHETTGGNEQTLPVDRRQTVPGRERNDEIAADLRTGIRRQEQAAVRCPRKSPMVRSRSAEFSTRPGTTLIPSDGDMDSAARR